MFFRAIYLVCQNSFPLTWSLPSQMGTRVESPRNLPFFTSSVPRLQASHRFLCLLWHFTHLPMGKSLHHLPVTSSLLTASYSRTLQDSETMAVIRRAASETPYPDLLPPPLPSPLYCLQTSEPLSHCHSFLHQLPSSSAAAGSGMQTSRVG